MERKIPGGGNPTAKIMIVGEFPSQNDLLRGEVFSDEAGQALGKMLHEAGIMRSEVYLTNVFKYAPPAADIAFWFDEKTYQSKTPIYQQGVDELAAEIAAIKPNVIIALGNIALYALTGKKSVSTWRGSELWSDTFQVKVIPTYHPADVLRMWVWRAETVHDIRHALRESNTPDLFVPPYSFTIRPTAQQCIEIIDMLLTKAATEELILSVDLETRVGHIACCGIAWTIYDALCIPFMCTERPDGYFSYEEEVAVTIALKVLLTHPNVKCVGQNFLYDAQYFSKHWGYVPNLTDDTMFEQHIMWPGMPKALDYISSLYCDHYVFWKNEGKEWEAKMPEEQLWVYNGKDCCNTLECHLAMRPAIAASRLEEPYIFQMQLWWSVLRMMLLGVRIDQANRGNMAQELLQAIHTREVRLYNILGHQLNVKSPKQMKEFFYNDLLLPVQKNRKTRQPSTDDKALQALALKEPLVRPICEIISELRSLGVFLSTFVNAPLDTDQRMRCSFNPAGTETYRFSSSENAFGSGTNLQNIPKGDEDELKSEGELTLPNIRKLFIPDPGYIIFDIDLAGADAQVVAWEADDADLKAVFRAKKKLHTANAKQIFGEKAGADGKQEPYYTRAKMGVHLTNYGGQARTCATALSIPLWEAEQFQRTWFTLHPNISTWHETVQDSLNRHRAVYNKFGYRRFYFDRLERLLPEALAWIPQSTVACVVNRALVRIDREIPLVQLLLQVHDSLVGQCKKEDWWRVKPMLQEAFRVLIPYDDPLIINAGLKASAISWGHCTDESWGD